MKNRIDVILPVHGPAPFLSQAISSIFENTEYPTKLLIVKDRCKNTHLNSLIEFPPKNFQVVVLTSEVTGIVAALNLGISFSDSDFIARMDADDVMSSSRLSTQAQFLENNPRVVCVGTQLIFINEAGTRIGHTNYPTTNEEIIKRMRYQNCLAHPSVMFRRSALQSNEPYRKQFTGAEDYDLWTRLSVQGELRNLDEKLLEYRYSSYQYTNQIKPKQNLLENCIRVSWEIRKMNHEKPETVPKSEDVSDLKVYFEEKLEYLKKENFKSYRKIRASESLNVLLQARGSGKNSISLVPMILKSLTSSLILSPRLTGNFIVGHIKYHSILKR